MIEVLFSGVVVVAVGELFSKTISGNGWSNTGGNFIAVGEGIGGGGGGGAGRGVLACVWADAVIVQIRMEKMQWRMVFEWYCKFFLGVWIIDQVRSGLLKMAIESNTLNYIDTD